MIRTRDFYKVGIADRVKTRLAQLQAATPYRIELVKSWECMNARSQERRIHGLLWRFHERGEWFKLPIEVVLAALDDINPAGPTALVFLADEVESMSQSLVTKQGFTH